MFLNVISRLAPVIRRLNFTVRLKWCKKKKKKKIKNKKRINEILVSSFKSQLSWLNTVLVYQLGFIQRWLFARQSDLTHRFRMAFSVIRATKPTITIISITWNYHRITLDGHPIAATITWWYLSAIHFSIIDEYTSSSDIAMYINSSTWTSCQMIHFFKEYFSFNSS